MLVNWMSIFHYISMMWIGVTGHWPRDGVSDSSHQQKQFTMKLGVGKNWDSTRPTFLPKAFIATFANIR
jgi:hypothetical protein